MFPNITSGPFVVPDGYPLYLGVDFNETNVLVEWAVYGRDAYALSEHAPPNPKTGLDLGWLSSCYPHHKKGVEGGGYNTGFAMEAIKHNVTVLENSAPARSQRVVNALKYHLFIDPVRTPQLWEDTHKAQWDKHTPMKILKDDQHPNHYLDAGLLGLPQIDGGVGLWTRSNTPPHDREEGRVRLA